MFYADTSTVMDKLSMSPQMKAILLSFKNLHLKPNSSQDIEVLKSLNEEEKDLDCFLSEERSQALSSPSRLSKVNFSRTSENQSKSCTQEAISVQSNGAVRSRRRSWVVSKHILARSNTVDSLRLQFKSGDNCCSSKSFNESITVCGTGAHDQSNSAPQQTHSMAKENAIFVRRLLVKPKSASNVSINKPLSPVLNQRQPLYRTNTGRVGIKPSSAVIRRGNAATKTDSVWDNMSDQRTFLINKWLAPCDQGRSFHNK